MTKIYTTIYEQKSDEAKTCYNCNGFQSNEKDCVRYSPIEDECIWYRTIQNDIKKYEFNKTAKPEDNKPLTFNIETLIEND